MSHKQIQDKNMVIPGKGGPLADLLQGVAYAATEMNRLLAGTHVGAVTADSRQAAPGGVFVALPGTVTDGHHHVEEAARCGCVAVVVERGGDYSLPRDWEGVVIEVADSRGAYAAIAENFHGNPAARLKLVGVTGTNGKTTITYLLEDVLLYLGYRVGVIGTVNYRYSTDDGKKVLPSPFTTPEAMQLQGLLLEMVEAGVELVIMEVSSHALAQQRIGHLLYDVAGFTNLSRDHLDFHEDMEEYFRAKSLLFTRHLRPGAKAVISFPQQPEGETDWSARMMTVCRETGCGVVTTGKAETMQVRLLEYRSGLEKTSLRFRLDGREYGLTTPLVGHFNMDNLLTACGILQALGHGPKEIIAPLGASSGAPGRLQRVVAEGTEGGSNPVVFVDYAHTPDALRQVLATLAGLPHRDLFCVFGCGGDRDGGKRPVMGSFAAAFATVVVVTDDNPRTEDPERIRSQIMPGVIKAGLEEQDVRWLETREPGERGFVMLGDRSMAIDRTVRAAGEGDIVLVAGKGHENYQLTRAGKRYFDDYLEAQCALLSWNLQMVAAATNGTLAGEGPEGLSLAAVSTDSRSIGPGDIFVALQGERFDGHDFLDEVAAKGAGCLVVARGAREVYPSGVVRVEVKDTLLALGDLARYRRRLVGQNQEQRIIAITGSCGKTTVKEMTAAIMRRLYPPGPQFPGDAVLATRGNLNNLIGLPLTLLPISPRQRVAVLEMGMNAPGEIRAMARAAEPDICCITNVHGVHLEGLGDLDGVARAKGELFAEADSAAVLVVNLDDEKICGLVAGETRRMIRYGIDRSDADLFVTDIEPLPESLRFCLHRQGEAAKVKLNTVGLHNIANGLAAAAIATAAGASLAEIVAGLEDFRPADRRMVRLSTTAGVGVLNDTYNANPASMEAGLKTLVAMGGSRCLALLGDMLELGAGGAAAHARLGRQVAELGVDFLGVVGSFRAEVAQAAVAAGMDMDTVRMFADKEEAAAWVEALVAQGKIGKGDWILVKASRGLRMETIVDRLTGNT